MRIQATGEEGESTLIALDNDEASHLLAFLFHAKFSDDVRLEIVGSPTMQALIKGLLEAREEAGDQLPMQSWAMSEEGGNQAPLSFLKIESRLRNFVRAEEFDDALADHLFPYVWENSPTKDRYITPGTRVRLPGSEASDASGERYGIVVDCRANETNQRFDCRVVEQDSQTPNLSVERFPALELVVV